MRIVCVKWGDKYPNEYVIKLYAMCRRHVPHFFEFVCVTDDETFEHPGITTRPMMCEYPGWWQKVGLFKEGCLPGWNMYIDLDVIITSSLAALIPNVHMNDKLHCVDDFSYSLVNPKQGLGPDMQRLLGGVGTVQSSVMFWDSHKGSPVHKFFSEFTPEKMDEVHGDQNWITQCLYPEHIQFLPKGFIQSYKYGNQQEAPLVVFHGDPKPHQVRDAWAVKHWTT